MTVLLASLQESDWFLHEQQFAYGDSCFLPESLWWSCVPRPVPASGEGWLGMVWQVVCYFAALALSMYGAMLHCYTGYMFVHVHLHGLHHR